MRKIFLLLFIILLVLAIDGALTYDILDYPAHFVGGWLGPLLVLVIFFTIAAVESVKKNEKRNTRR
ncbi:MAG: hypothetical protein ACE5E9_07305 [Nitrospinaceae bacterium]